MRGLLERPMISCRCRQPDQKELREREYEHDEFFAQEVGLRQEAQYEALLRRLENEGVFTSLEEASMIMGPNFFGVREVVESFGITDEAAMLRLSSVQLSSVPFSRATLLRCRKTHVLFLGFPFDLVEIRQRMGRLWPGWSTSRGDFSYDDEDYSRERVGCRWYLIRKSLVPGSFMKTHWEQEAMLDVVEERPSAVEVAYMTTLNMMVRLRPLLDKNSGARHFDLFTIERLKKAALLFESYGIWTSSHDSRNCAVIIGNASAHRGIAISNYDPTRRSPNVGLVSSIKPNVIGE